MDPFLAFVTVSVLILFSPVFLVAYAMLTDTPTRRDASVLPGDYHPVANRPRPGEAPGRCPACGADNDAVFDYCRECGAALDDEADDRTPSLDRLLGAE